MFRINSIKINSISTRVLVIAGCMAVFATGAQAFDIFGRDAIQLPVPQQQANFPADLNRAVETTRTIVDDPTGENPGTITIDTKNRYLYLSMENNKAMRYDVGVGREGFAWQGRAYIGRRAEWPGWTPPAEMLKRRPDLPRHMAGGIDNPLGARAMYLYNDRGDTMYRIHGTNEPDTIGQAVSSGCIRLMNEDVIDLYDRVRVGATVVVIG